MTIRRVLSRAHHAVVIGLEEGADDGEDDDCENGEDEACPCVHYTDDGLHGCGRGALRCAAWGVVVLR